MLTVLPLLLFLLSAHFFLLLLLLFFKYLMAVCTSLQIPHVIVQIVHIVLLTPSPFFLAAPFSTPLSLPVLLPLSLPRALLLVLPPAPPVYLAHALPSPREAAALPVLEVEEAEGGCNGGKREARRREGRGSAREGGGGGKARQGGRRQTRHCPRGLQQTPRSIQTFLLFTPYPFAHLPYPGQHPHAPFRVLLHHGCAGTPQIEALSVPLQHCRRELGNQFQEIPGEVRKGRAGKDGEEKKHGKY
jgi:hypothetical protein